MPAKRPAVGDPQGWLFPTAHEFVLDNGARVWAFDLPGQHVVSVDVVMDLPASCEPGELEGLGTIVARTSDEGSTRHPGAGLAEAVESLGAVYGASARMSSTVAQIDVPGTRLSPALDLLAEIIWNPSHDLADVQRHIDLRLAEIDQARVHPGALVQLGLQRALLDPTTRIGRPTAGLPGTVSAITQPDVVRYHQRWWRPDGATIIVAGSLGDDIADLVAASLEAWEPGGRRPLHARTHANPATGQVIVIDRPEAVQADIRIGMVGPDRHHPQWAALEIAGCALGGSFSSRLNTVLREEKGYTYGAHAGFHPYRDAGMFIMQTSCRTEVAADAVLEALRIADVAAAPFTTAEIVDARNYLLGIAPLTFATADAIADQASAMAAAGMSPLWINAHQARLATVGPEEATGAFIDQVDPAALTTVICGDADQLVPALNARGLITTVWASEDLFELP